MDIKCDPQDAQSNRRHASFIRTFVAIINEVGAKTMNLLIVARLRLSHPNHHAMTRGRVLLPDFVFPLYHVQPFMPRPCRSDQTPVAGRVSRNGQPGEMRPEDETRVKYNTISET